LAGTELKRRSPIRVRAGQILPAVSLEIDLQMASPMPMPPGDVVKRLENVAMFRNRPGRLRLHVRNDPISSCVERMTSWRPLARDASIASPALAIRFTMTC